VRGSLAFALRDPFAWPRLRDLVVAGESLGYQALFLPEIGAREGFATLSGLAGETRRLLLGTGVVPIASRTAKTTAMGAATVQERSGGRLILGLGAGPATPGALDRLRGYVEETRRLLREGLGLHVEAPPIWIAALGPRATRLAGEIADGVLLNWCTPERVSRAVVEVREGAAGAGRDPGSVTVAVYVRGALGDPAAAALRAAAAEYAGYPAYARQFAAMGVDARDPDEVVGAVCLPPDGGPARRRLDEYRAAGADLPVVYPVATSEGAEAVERVLRALAPDAGTLATVVRPS
jgi:alkanesulfonate monooxygenase SsuD/methylene tetrahydromethanopterin reductase-like flavin-dependent oxidoreductase (luciferase family)